MSANLPEGYDSWKIDEPDPEPDFEGYEEWLDAEIDAERDRRLQDER